jgi:hypothetical protein
MFADKPLAFRANLGSGWHIAGGGGRTTARSA